MPWNPYGIVGLYEEVLQRERNNMNILDQLWECQIRKGFEEITSAHNPDNQNIFSSNTRKTANYNKVGVRCAYVHRFASLYTGLAYEMLSLALRDESEQIPRNLRAKRTYLQLCCLGGGPGTDLVGVWSALYHYFGKLRGSATVVDEMFGWENTVNSVIDELQSGYYSVSPAFDPVWFDWSFLTADLLGEMAPRVKEKIGCADMVTMFKFLSAAACEGTEKMLEKIFDIMRPGALVFFINNSAGGYHELVNRVAAKFQFVTIFGPLPHEDYSHEAFKVFRFDNESLWKTTVTVQILMKPYA